MMNVQLSLGEKIKAAIKASKYTQEEVAELLGTTRQTMNNWLKQAKIEQEFLENLRDKTGIDFTNAIANSDSNLTEGDLMRKKKAFAPSTDNGLIYVPIAAQAGYTKHFEDQVYLSQMERLYIPGNPFKGDKYRYFEVEGDSMAPTLLDGMQVIAQKIEQEDWMQIRNYYIHVVVTMSQILVKRLYKANDTTFILISDNDELYAQEQMDLKSVRELWVVKRSLDWRIPPPKNFEITIDTKSKNN